jgi:hypothetical protein
MTTYHALVLKTTSEPLSLEVRPIPNAFPGSVVVKALGRSVLPYFHAILNGSLTNSENDNKQKEILVDHSPFGGLNYSTVELHKPPDNRIARNETLARGRVRENLGARCDRD